VAHIHELYDFTVGFFIVYDDKILLVNHPRYNRWIPPGGHIEMDEDPEEALYREIKEETGLDVTILANKVEGISSPGTKFIYTPNFMDVHEANPPHKHIGLNYFAVAKTDQAKLSDEHTELRWFSRDELHDPSYELSAAVIFYCEQALDTARSQALIKH
jgi:ADP-ribose pyrophosphatase YjhB (NUDIX family)